MHSKLSGERWILDQSSIFAQVDAFVQRCKDLLEVLYKLFCLDCSRELACYCISKMKNNCILIRCEMSEWKVVLKLSLVDDLLL